MNIAVTDAAKPLADLAERSLLIVEDDKSFLQRLARAMEARGFEVTTAESVGGRPAAGREGRRRPLPWSTCGSATATASTSISALKQRRPDARAIILTGYGNIATAVNAVKIGAVDYLAKPADADDVVAALLAIEGRKAEPPEHPMSADRVRWEHIQRIYELCGRNVRRPRAGSTCTAAPCSASWPSARRADFTRHSGRAHQRVYARRAMGAIRNPAADSLTSGFRVRRFAAPRMTLRVI